MKVLYIIFAIVSAIVAIGVLADTSVEVISEKKRNGAKAEKSREEKCKEQNVPSATPAVEETEPMPAEIMPEAVEEIDVEAADMLISDELAMSAVSYERGAGNGLRGIVNIGSIDGAFEKDSVVTVEALREKGLLAPNVKRVKILADGILHKPLTVKAEAFSVRAIKMIELTGGTAVILQD